jgi:hypothetical protein
MTTPDVIQLILLVITILGLGWSILNNTRELKSLKVQMQLSLYADYTKRYQEIILNLPENINKADYKLDTLDEEVYNKTMRYMRAYFDLCNEEYELAHKKHIEDDSWAIWRSGIEYAFTKTAFKQAWLKVQTDTKYSSSFTTWISKIVQGTTA